MSSPEAAPEERSPAARIDLSTIRELVGKQGINLGFFYGMIQVGGQDRFAFCSRADSLVLVDLDGGVARQSLRPWLRPSTGYCASTISGKDLWMIEPSGQTLFHLRFNDSLQLSLLDTLQLGRFFKDGQMIRGGRIATGLLYLPPRLAIGIGHRKRRNFIGTQALIILDLEKKQANLQLDFPDEYAGQRMYHPEPLLARLDSQKLAYAFIGSDWLGLLEPASATDRRTRLHHDCILQSFDEDREQNLGYVQRYLETNETNYKLITQNGKLALLKQRGKLHKTEPTQLECFVYDSSFGNNYRFLLEKDLSPPMIFPYRRGFLAFKKDLATALYYELP